MVRHIERLIDGDDHDDEDGAGALLADAARSPMGTLPFALMPPLPPAKRLTASVDDSSPSARNDGDVVTFDAVTCNPSSAVSAVKSGRRSMLGPQMKSCRSCVNAPIAERRYYRRS